MRLYMVHLQRRASTYIVSHTVTLACHSFVGLQLCIIYSISSQSNVNALHNSVSAMAVWEPSLAFPNFPKQNLSAMAVWDRNLGVTSTCKVAGHTLGTLEFPDASDHAWELQGTFEYQGLRV
jgi:hypothetical protein